MNWKKVTKNAGTATEDTEGDCYVGSNGSKPSEKDYKEEMAKNRKGIVNFHSEMVQLVN